MRKQRNMAQMKEHIKTPEKELKKMKRSNLSDAEFKTLVISNLSNTGSRNLWGLQQHKKDQVRNKGYTNWNKEQFTGKQQ